MVNIWTSLAYHLFTLNEADEVLTKGAIEPSTSGVGFYCNVFMVPKLMGSL